MQKNQDDRAHDSDGVGGPLRFCGSSRRWRWKKIIVRRLREFPPVSIFLAVCSTRIFSEKGKPLRTPSKLEVGSVGLLFVGSLAAEIAVDPLGNHDTLPKSAVSVTASAGSTIGTSMAVVMYANNAVTDDDYAITLPSWTRIRKST